MIFAYFNLNLNLFIHASGTFITSIDIWFFNNGCKGDPEKALLKAGSIHITLYKQYLHFRTTNPPYNILSHINIILYYWTKLTKIIFSRHWPSDNNNALPDADISRPADYHSMPSGVCGSTMLGEDNVIFLDCKILTTAVKRTKVIVGCRSTVISSRIWGSCPSAIDVVSMLSQRRRRWLNIETMSPHRRKDNNAGLLELKHEMILGITDISSQRGIQYGSLHTWKQYIY